MKVVVIATVVHVPFLVVVLLVTGAVLGAVVDDAFRGTGVGSEMGDLLGDLAVWLLLLAGAVVVGCMCRSAWLLGQGADGARENAVKSTAAAVGSEASCLGLLLYDALSGTCPPEQCLIGNKELALLEVLFCVPLLVLGVLTIVLLRTRSVAVRLRAP